MLLKRMYPQHDLKVFRDLSQIRPYSDVYKMLASIPETVTSGGIKALLPEYRQRLTEIFATHKDPVVYELRDVALFGISECERSERFIELLKTEDYVAIGQMMKVSHNGDRLGAVKATDAYLEQLMAKNTPFAQVSGAYNCSTGEIDYLCNILKYEPPESHKGFRRFFLYDILRQILPGKLATMEREGCPCIQKTSN